MIGARLATLRHRRRARREDLGLTRREFAILRRLDTPQKIQAFLNAIPINHEIGGETMLSVRQVLRQRRAHCIEGAFVAACAFWVNGKPPLVMYMDCAVSDVPHVLALFRQGGGWGAISKTNGAHLRYRDPIYDSLLPRVLRQARKQDPAQLFGDVRPEAARSGTLGDCRG